MDGEASLYMCPCYKLFQSLEEVLVHQLTCQTANEAVAPPPAQAELQAAELYANAPAGQSVPAGPAQAGPDPHHQDLDSPSAIVPDQAPGQHCPPAAVDAAKLNGLLLGMRPPPRRASRQAAPSGAPAAAPLIRYQCGECGLLFESLPLWQRHNKLGQCGQEAGQEPRAQEEKPAEGGRESEKKKEAEEEKNESVDMAEPEPQMKVERMEEGEEEKVEVSQCGEKLPTFDHSYQGKEAGLEGSSKDEAIAEHEQQTQEVPSSSKHGSESSPLASVEPQVSSASDETSLDRTFLCVCCGAALGSLEALASHRKARHGLEGALHCCQVCGKEFMNTTLFLYHQRQHRHQGPAPSTEISPAKAGLVSQGSIPQMKSETGGEGAVVTTETETDSGVIHPHPIGAVSVLSANVEPCPHCGQTFKRRCHLRAHLQCHSGRKPHRCDLCPKVFAYKSNLGRHRHTHGGVGSDERPHVCERCGRGFAHAGSLRQHALLHERQDARQQAGQEGEPRPYACADCPASFRTQGQLQVHSYKHTGNYPFSCSECGQSFLRKKRLELHALIHQGKQPVPCPRCPELFLGQPDLDAHLPICPRKTHPAEDPEEDEAEATSGRRVRRRRRGQLTCDLCGHRCVTQSGLDLHRLAHAGLTPLRCPRTPCRQRFAAEAALQEHLLVHDNADNNADDKTPGANNNNNNNAGAKPRPYHCMDCGKDFTTASSLSVHLRIHTGERPFQCTQCGKRFRQIPHLRDHERLHSDERPFACGVCGRSFVLAARLAEHARTHSGDKPYSCPLCPRTFRSLSNLGKHRKTHARAPAGSSSSSSSSAAAAAGLPGKLTHRLGTAGGGVGGGMVALAQGETQALVLPAVGEGQAAVHTILLLHSQPGSAPAFATLPLGESTSGAAAAPPSSSPSYSSPSPSAPLVLMHPSVALGDGHPGQLGPVVSHAIEVIVTETGE